MKTFYVFHFTRECNSCVTTKVMYVDGDDNFTIFFDFDNDKVDSFFTDTEKETADSTVNSLCK